MICSVLGDSAKQEWTPQYHVCFIGSTHRTLSCLATAVSDVSATSYRVPGYCYCLHVPTCWCIALRACNSSLSDHCCSVYLGVTLGRHCVFPLILRSPPLVLGTYPLAHSVLVRVLFVTFSWLTCVSLSINLINMYTFHLGFVSVYWVSVVLSRCMSLYEHNILSLCLNFLPSLPTSFIWLHWVYITNSDILRLMWKTQY